VLTQWGATQHPSNKNKRERIEEREIREEDLLFDTEVR
jgi:hypothetical protein